MKTIGRLAFVQIQRSQMKVFTAPNHRVYRPDPLLPVERLLLTAQGILGYDEAGEQQMDVHHELHPQTRNRGDNSISLGFLQHYQSLRERFGAHMRDGVGGENMLVTLNPDFNPAATPSRLYIESVAEGHIIELVDVQPAPPCVEFSQFTLSRDGSPQEIKETLQFLEGGRRGYYAALVEQDCQCIVQAGDLLLYD